MHCSITFASSDCCFFPFAGFTLENVDDDDDDEDCMLLAMVDGSEEDGIGGNLERIEVSNPQESME